MNIDCIEIQSNRKLYIIKRPEKKSVVIWIMFYFPLDSNASLNALLSKILIKGSSNFKTSRIISKVLYENYGASFGADINLKGEVYTLGFYSDFVSPKIDFIDKSLIENICSLIKDIVFNPLLENGCFSEKYFEIEKDNLINDINNKVNNKASYALDRCIEIMCEGEPYSIDKLGKTEWAKGASIHSLTARYFNIIHSSPLNIYVTGNISDEFIENIKSLFPASGAETTAVKNADNKKEGIIEIEENFDVLQSRFCFGFRTGIDLNSPDFPALVLFNNMLGGGPHSLLFNWIREEKGLCYSINSSLEKYKGLLFVNCGIEGKNNEFVKNMVMETVEKIKNGDIISADFENALINVKHNLAKLSDDSYYYISYLQGLNIYNSTYSLEDFTKMLSNVTKDNIAAVSKKIKLDTIYFLGSKNRE